jgi:nucleotide-binding universal stress UspA family protein
MTEELSPKSKLTVSDTSPLFRKILIPLDGFDLSEEAIPYGEELVKKTGSELILFHVCEHNRKSAHNIHQNYLERIAEDIRKRLGENPLNHIKPSVSTVHLVGDFIQEICDYVSKKNIDLVIMADYDIDLKEKLLGTITEKVYRKIICPTLLVRVTDVLVPMERKGAIKKILVPLDGSTGSEIILPLAQELAQQYKAELALFMVGEKTSYGTLEDDLDEDWEKLDELTWGKCYGYLEGIESKINRVGVNTSIGVALGDNLAKEIRNYGKKINADIIAMATRGKAPIIVWPIKSTAFKLLEIGRLPLLLVKTK